MLKSAEKTAILSISEKLDTAQRMQVCPLTSVHYLVTELDTANEKLKNYTKFFHLL